MMVTRSEEAKVSRYALTVPYEPERGIVYHMAARHLLLVRSDLWADLRRFPGTRNGDGDSLTTLSATKEELELLKRHRLIVPSTEDEQLFARYILNSLKYNTSDMSVLISFTPRCNFACGYCYQDFRKGRPPSDLSPKRWRSLFAFITKRVSELGVRHLSVALFGGEPLLNLDVVHRACEDLKRLESSGCNVHLTLITNGSLLHPEVWSDLEPYVESVQITIDGPREIHDRSRPFADGSGSYEAVVENAVSLARQAPGRLAVRVNIHSDTLSSVQTLLMDLCELRIQAAMAAVDFQPISPSQQQVCAGACGAYDQNRIAAELGDLFITAASMGFPVTKSFEVGPCMYAAANSLVVDERLNLYKCPALLYWRPIGRVDRRGRAELDSAWYEAIAYEPRCVLSCRYGPICYGGCRAMAGGSKHIKCMKPFFDAALEKLIKAYAIARHKHRWVGEMHDG
jgi:uncharacterized protein